MKKWIIISIIFAILLGVGIVYARICVICPWDGTVGHKISYKGPPPYTYTCINGHIWQCGN